MKQKLPYLAVFFVGYLLAWFLHASAWSETISNFVTGKGRIWNWCPTEVNEVLFLANGRRYTEPDDLRKICAFRIEGESKESTPGEFTAIMKAQNGKGQLTFVEIDASGVRFRIEGRLFTSLQFQANILRFR